MSANCSYRKEYLSFLARMDKKERKLLVINNIVATPVNSSINVPELYLDILSEVKTTRQNPIRVEDVVRICCDLLFGMTVKLIKNR